MPHATCTVMDYRAVYTYYDQPLNFSFTREEEAGIFYGHLVDSDDSGDTFWVVKVTANLLKQAEDGLIDMRTLMSTPASPLDGVESVHSDGSVSHYTLTDALKRYADGLPKPGRLLVEDDD